LYIYGLHDGVVSISGYRTLNNRIMNWDRCERKQL